MSDAVPSATAPPRMWTPKRFSPAQWVAISLYGILLAVLTVRAHGLTYDEKTFYLPAIVHAASRLPAVSISDYNFPGPPLGLIVQSVIYRVSGERWMWLRLTSLFCSLFAAVLTLRRFSTPASLIPPGVWFLFITCPFALFNALTFKQHALAILCVAGAYLAFDRSPDAASVRMELILSVLLVFAVMITQMTLPFAVVVWICGLLRYFRVPGKSNAAGALILAAPLAATAILFVVWRGFQPPSYHASAADSGPAPFAFLLPQFVLCGMALGAWLFPAASFTRKDVVRVAALWPFCALLAHLSGLFSATTFDDSAVGPISSVIRTLFRSSPYARAAAAGLLLAAGCSFAVLVFLEFRNRAAFMYIAIYILMMSAVRFYFESYSLLLLLGLHLFLWREFFTAGQTRSVRIRQYAIAFCGVLYVVVKVFGRTPTFV